MRMPICHCSRCHSPNTSCVNAELQREHWYCYDCGRGVEVPAEDAGHRTPARPHLHSTSAVSSRLNVRSGVDTRSPGVKW